MIEVRNLTRRFGSHAAVDDLSFDAKSGRVTGFLGPNGAGKSTTMRCIVGLDHISGGTATVDGVDYKTLTAPLAEVGTLLDAGYVHPGRRGIDHLRWIAATNKIPKSRVAETLEMVGMSSAADKRLRQYSLGMRQRLGLASAMLGDPHTLILDEPANGLDPEGVRWVRDFLKMLASQGRTVLVSSHLLSEMSLMADDLVVIGRGRLIAQGTVSDFVDQYSLASVKVASPQADVLVRAIEAAGNECELGPQPGELIVRGMTTAEVGELAGQHHIVLHELGLQRDSLEDVFLSVTGQDQEYRTQEVQS